MLIEKFVKVIAINGDNDKTCIARNHQNPSQKKEPMPESTYYLSVEDSGSLYDANMSS